jgi:pimeloyl-ACP methyl ester carboxylesterase
MAARHGAGERLAGVACPVTFVSGGRTDTPFGDDLLRRLAEQLPDGRVEVFPELGHFGPLQDPAAIAASIRRALTR